MRMQFHNMITVKKNNLEYLVSTLFIEEVVLYKAWYLAFNTN